MDFFSVINVALPVIYVLVGIVLVWFVIELVMTGSQDSRNGDERAEAT